MKRAAFTSVALALASMTAASAADSGLAVRVAARGSTGTIHCAVFAAERGFPGDTKAAMETASVGIETGRAVCRFPSLPPGTYAVAVYQDENGNGVLETNAFGIPKEPLGFSRNPSARFGPPRFTAAAFALGPAPLELDVGLQH
jgi:uncharacterized protein (DUF2141 family)